MRLVPGARLGCYEVADLLGVGGMGEVYRARDTKLGRDVALKVMSAAFAEDAERMGRFTREAKVLASLNHSSIAAIYGLEESGDVDCLVLELVEGADLGRLLRAYAARDERFPAPLALFIASQMLRGLHHAHTRSAGEGSVIVHRDVSPSNVLCSAEGEVKVADFGVALVTRARQAGGSGAPGRRRSACTRPRPGAARPGEAGADRVLDRLYRRAERRVVADVQQDGRHDRARQPQAGEEQQREQGQPADGVHAAGGGRQRGDEQPEGEQSADYHQAGESEPGRAHRDGRPEGGVLRAAGEVGRLRRRGQPPRATGRRPPEAVAQHMSRGAAASGAARSAPRRTCREL